MRPSPPVPPALPYTPAIGLRAHTLPLTSPDRAFCWFFLLTASPLSLSPLRLWLPSALAAGLTIVVFTCPPVAGIAATAGPLPPAPHGSFRGSLGPRWGAVGGPSPRLGCFYGGTFVAAPCVIPRCPARPASWRALLLFPLSGPFSCAAAFPPVLLCSRGMARRAATRARGGVRRTRGAPLWAPRLPPVSAALGRRRLRARPVCPPPPPLPGSSGRGRRPPSCCLCCC